MRRIHPAHAGGPEPSIAGTIRGLSNRLVAALRPLNVLRALRWDRHTEDLFLAHAGRELPAVTPEYYRTRPLGFDAQPKLDELADLEREIQARLSSNDGPGRIMQRICRESVLIVRLLLAR